MSTGVCKGEQRPLNADTSGAEVRSSALDLLQQTRERLESGLARPDIDQDEIVHQTRVDMKRLRALWYLAEPGLKEKQVLHEATRRIAKALSGQRDHAVMQATCQSLPVDLPDAFKKQLDAGLLDHTRPAAHPEQPLSEVSPLLYALKCKVMDADFEGLRQCHLKTGFLKVAKKGEKLSRKALQRADQEALHRWRKWVKVWMYQHLWLVPGTDFVWSERLKPLGSALGRIHDLDVLDGILQQLDQPESLDTLNALQYAIQQERNRLLGQVTTEAAVIYAKPAKKRVKKVFCAWSKD